MNTPIVDFVREYAESCVSRFHMPGHKGRNFLGFEKFDITEIDGADVLSLADGIINESEENASSLFSSAHSFYVTQGSSTAICAMLALVKRPEPERTVILAARNVHKAFVNACALLDLEVEWIMPGETSDILQCKLSAEEVRKSLEQSSKKPAAVYLTSPDYLGNIQDIKGISLICKEKGIPLLVDNAHGAYLKFLEKSLHPLDMGADACCDSAHKTLSVLTGGAYLHISKNAPVYFAESARQKIALFSSTSPSYLILQSLDLCNAYLDDEYKKELFECVDNVAKIKEKIIAQGFSVQMGEPLKIVINAKKSGYLGTEIADILRNNSIEPEFCDDDYLVLMITPQNSCDDLKRLEKVFSLIPPRKPMEKELLVRVEPQRVMSVRTAVFAENVEVNVKESAGRICAELTVSCPPAVPISVCGELITDETVRVFKKYGITKVRVVKD